MALVSEQGTTEEYCYDGSNFGEITYDEKRVILTSRTGKTYFELKLDNLANCAVTDKNSNEVELQFLESENIPKEEDSLVQIRFHFPDGEAEEEEGVTKAEEFESTIRKSLTKSVSGHIIVEFDKEEGTFITPRGKYGIQMYSSFMRMHGAKYDYKIQYEDIGKLFLLPKPDNVHNAIVICLEKPIRQGNQRYQHLVLQTHMREHTVKVNLTDEELEKEYGGQLTSEMSGALGNLFAKAFKIISNSKVFVPKNFKSDRDTYAVKCSLRASDGLLYPLEKSFVFIHKPTVLISFDDIESIEFQRYNAAASSATRNFDLVITLRAGAKMNDAKEFNFSGIDRAEYGSLFQFLASKKLNVKNPEQSTSSESLWKRLDTELGPDEEDSDEEEDGDYEGGKSDDEDDDGSGSESEGDEDEGEARKKVKKVPPPPAPSADKRAEAASASSPSKGRAPKSAKPQAAEKGSGSGKGEKRKAPGKKDKNAPKKGKSAYFYFLDDVRPGLKQKNPEASLGGLSKLAADLWKNVTKEEKERYEELAAQDKKRYQDQMADYQPPEDDGNEEDTGKQKKKRQKKDKDAPKGPLSAYFIFSADMRNKIREATPDLSMVEMTKEIGARWREMSAADKAPYEEKSRKDKERYSNEMKAYAASKAVAADVEEVEEVEEEADDDDGEDDEGDEAGDSDE